MADTEVALPSLKDLASSDASLRRSCLSTILSHLSSLPPTSPLTATQCLQLWRGFFVCLYMHDSKNQISVQNLIRALASTFATISEKDDESDDNSNGIWTARYTEAFWETMCREWAGIDSHRMNKVLLLIRMVIREIFEVCLASLMHSDHAATEEELSVAKRKTEQHRGLFEKWPLSPRERQVPDGVRYHVLDVWVEELKRLGDEGVGVDGEGNRVELPLEIMADFMVPVKIISRESLSKGVKTRAKDTLNAFQRSFGGEGIEALRSLSKE